MSIFSGRRRLQVNFEGVDSLTQQAFKHECDLNKIFKKFRNVHADKVLSMFDSSGLMYGDFSKVPDYQTALHMIKDAEKAFYQLPSEVRKQWSSPAAFLDALADPAQQGVMRSLGLLRETQSQDVQKQPAEGA